MTVTLLCKILQHTPPPTPKCPENKVSMLDSLKGGSWVPQVPLLPHAGAGLPCSLPASWHWDLAHITTFLGLLWAVQPLKVESFLSRAVSAPVPVPCIYGGNTHILVSFL